MLERFEGMDVQTVSDEIAAPGFEQAILILMRTWRQALHQDHSQ
jgi:hypothetical protein